MSHRLAMVALSAGNLHACRVPDPAVLGFHNRPSRLKIRIHGLGHTSGPICLEGYLYTLIYPIVPIDPPRHHCRYRLHPGPCQLIDQKSSIGSCQSRRKPAGPRAPHRTRRRPGKPVLRIDTSARLDESRLPQSAESFADILRSHTPKIPPSLASSPNNYLLDWDAIFRILGASYDVSQDG